MLQNKRTKRITALVAIILISISLVTPAGAANLKAGDSVYLGGMPFGVKFLTGTMTISGFSQVDSENGPASPAADSGLMENDIILTVNGKEVISADEVTKIVEESDGKKVTFICKRGADEITVTVIPVKSTSCGKYRIGMWIKDSTAGIGTITYVIPETGGFGGLGHGICDSDTGMLIPVKRGIVSDVTISGINKGTSGAPGELKGYFSSEKTGIVSGNTENGVFGLFTDITNLRQSDKQVKLASKDETKSGEAKIICTLDNNTTDEFTVEILCDKKSSENKCFSITVTDQRLLEKTGGIVQGMSGSPVIQNGKLVGAVTHVLISDSAKGYGIYIENMLSQMPDILK